MAQIKVGPFGYSTIQPAPRPDVAPQYEAAGSLGRVIVGLGAQAGAEQQRILAENAAKARALNRQQQVNLHEDAQLQVKEIAEAVRQRIDSGELAPDQAGSEFDRQTGKLTPEIYKSLSELQNTPHQPGLSGGRVFDTAMTAAEREGFDGSYQRMLREGRDVVNAHAHATFMHSADTNLDTGFDSLSKQAALPGASVDIANQKGDILARLAREAGVPEERVAGKLQAFKDQTWLNNATQSFLASRDSMHELAQLEHNLTAKDGLYAEKLDVNRRNELLGQVLARHDHLEEEQLRQAAANEKGAAKLAEARALEERLHQGQLLDPKDTDHRKFVDSLFSARTEQAGIAPGTPEWQVAAIDVGVRTGIVPEAVDSWLRTSSMSGDPISAANAAHVLGQLQQRNPQVLEFVDEKTKAFGLQVAAMAQAGTPSILAVPAVRKDVYGTTDQERDLQKQQYRKAVKDPAASLQSMLGSDDRYNVSLFHRTPTAPAGMVADFNRLSETYSATTKGDVARAQKLAYQDLQSRWGRTEVNGHPEIMRYPPEAFSVTAQEVRQDIAQAYPNQAKDITVVSDAATESRAYSPKDGHPLGQSWALIHTDPETGTITVLPERWHLPNAQDLKAHIAEARGAAIAKARADAAAAARLQEVIRSGGNTQLMTNGPSGTP